MIVWLATAAFAAPVTADEFVRQALAADPAIVRAEADLEDANGALAASRWLRENPTVEGAIGFGVGQAEVGVTQPISLTGEGLAATSAGRARVDEAEARLRRTRLVRAAEARILLAEAIAAEREAGIARAALERATALRTAIEAQTAAGDAAEVEARLSRLSEAASLGAWVSAVRERDRARIELAARSGWTGPFDLPPDPLAVVPAPGGTGARSDLLAAEHAADAARAELRRERAGVLPPVEVGVWASWENVATEPSPDGVVVQPWDPGTNVATTVGPSASVTLPLWHRNDAGRAAARARLQVAEADAVSVRASAETEQRAAAAWRTELDAVLAGLPPLRADDAVTAASDIERAYAEGELSGLEAMTWLDRIGAAERAALAASREHAIAIVQLALAEEWPTLVAP